MGVISELVKVASSALKILHGAPGRQVVATGKGLGGVSSESEVYNPSGHFARPPKGSHILVLPISGGKGRVAISAVNYQIVLECTDGETIIYSTDAAGTTVKAKIYLDANGNIDLNGNTKHLVTHEQLDTALGLFMTALNAHVHGSAGTPPVTPMTLNIAAAKTTTIRTGG